MSEVPIHDNVHVLAAALPEETRIWADGGMSVAVDAHALPPKEVPETQGR